MNYCGQLRCAVGCVAQMFPNGAVRCVGGSHMITPKEGIIIIIIVINPSGVIGKPAV